MKNTIILFVIILSSIVLLTGIFLNDIKWIAVGLVIIVFFVFYAYGKEKKDKKSILELMDNKDKSIFQPEEGVRKKQIRISFIMTILVALAACAVSWNFVSTYIFNPTGISVESIINRGCLEMDPRGGCDKDPSKIILPYDVNGNGVQGDANDTLGNLLGKYNCTGDCIKKRCTCPGY